MSIDDFLYSLGGAVERVIMLVIRGLKSFFFPRPRKSPPSFPISGRLSSKYTPHERVSLHLQLLFILYIASSFVLVALVNRPFLFLALSCVYLLYLRYALNAYGDFLIDPAPYRFFYYGLSLLSFLVFVGYLVLKRLNENVVWYYAYLLAVVVSVIAFWIYFKRKFGRDYTYGVVEEVKNDLLRVFVHDDISANVKPGFYWLPAVPDAEPGRVVKVLVENRAFRGARPVRILEVYLSQSSQSSTEPKNATE
ncbi:DUF2101 family protein [Thermococcus sp.]|uniref:DUF2101 family protein n=1 Tax=Thermococcus sp. TaxID=35749 RepID=UPI00260548FF|nr:DUF2101 family protein [Thermococcus sp.]